MKPYLHAKNSVKKFGGQINNYLEIHNWFDQTKAHVADMRHRLFLHNSFGCFLAEQVFGTYIINSEGGKVQVRDIAEQHILEDMGRIPSLQDCLEKVPFHSWLGVKKTVPKRFNLETGEFINEEEENVD